MQDSDRTEFAAIMASLAVFYPMKMNSIAIESWFRALKKYHVAQVRRLAERIIETRKYTSPPVPADFHSLYESDPWSYVNEQGFRLVRYDPTRHVCAGDGRVYDGETPFGLWHVPGMGGFGGHCRSEGKLYPEELAKPMSDEESFNHVLRYTSEREALTTINNPCDQSHCIEKMEPPVS